MARTIKEQTGVDLGDVVETPLAIPEPEPSATEEDTRPEWLDSKFESVEAQAKAYGEAQKAMSQAVERQRQSEQKIEELAARFDELSTQQQPDPQLAQANLLQQYEQAMEAGDAVTLAGLNAYIAQQAASAAVQEALSKWQPPKDDTDANSQMFAMMTEQQVAARYGDEWETLKPQVGQLLSEYPHLLPDTGDLTQTVNALSLVAEFVRNQGASAQQAQQDAGRQQKMLAQTMSGTTGRPDTQQQIDAADHLIGLMKTVR